MLRLTIVQERRFIGRSWFVLESRFIATLLFFSVLLYQSIGIFPIVAFEGDGVGIANGAMQMVFDGFGSRSLAYRYEVQSGTYILTAVLSYCTGLSTLTIFSLLSGMASIIFVVATAFMVQRITRYHYAVNGLIILLFQETMTAGYYANSTVIAAAFVLVAFSMVYPDLSILRLTVIGILLGLGIWMRFDAILVTPALLPIIHGQRWERTIRQIAIIGMIAASVSLGALYLSGSTLTAIRAAATTHMAATELNNSTIELPFVDSSFVRSFLSFFPVGAVILLVKGIYDLLCNRSWKLFTIWFCGSFPLLAVYGQRITTPKYLYYLLPFLAILILQATQAMNLPKVQSITAGDTLRRGNANVGDETLTAPILHKGRIERCGAANWGKIVVHCALLLLLLQGVIGIQLGFQRQLPSLKWYMTELSPTIVSLASLSIPHSIIRSATPVIGVGTLIPTDDGGRLASGLVFAPLLHSHQKRFMRNEIRLLRQFLEQPTPESLYIVVTHQFFRQLTLNLLVERGYTCNLIGAQKVEFTKNFVCSRAGHQVSLFNQAYRKSVRDGVSASEAIAFDGMLDAASVSSATILFLSSEQWEQERILRAARNWQQVGKFAYMVQF